MPTATPAQHQTKRREPWPTEITVVAMQDPVVDQLPDATPTTSDDTLLWWAGTLGPTAVLLARHLAAYAAEGPTLWPLEDLGRTFGIGPSVVAHSLERLVRFGVAARHGGTVRVRLMLPPLTARQRERLPQYLADAYPLQ